MTLCHDMDYHSDQGRNVEGEAVTELSLYDGYQGVPLTPSDCWIRGEKETNAVRSSN